jgi:predicted metal-dependent hydrolase
MRASSNIIWSSVISELRFGRAGTALTIKESPRAKVMRLKVDPRTGEIVLTVPRRMSRKRALAWADGHRAWIEKQLAEVPPQLAIEPEAVIPLYGIPHQVDWRPDRPRAVRVEQGRLVVGGPLEGLEQRLLRWLKAEARTLLARETREYAEKAGVSVSRVGVGDPVSRWGSCSDSGAIRYSWRLILAPDFVRRATVAHEVAHRVHMNHGRAFHILVKSLFEADPGPARHWLRREGASLHRIGRR